MDDNWLSTISVFNNRELAIGIWGIVIFTILVIFEPTRKILVSSPRIFLTKKPGILFVSAFVYMAVIVYVLQPLYNLDAQMIKNFILWFVFAASIYLADSVISLEASGQIKSNFKKLATFSLFIGFIVSAYPFSLSIELILIPISMIVAGTMAVSNQGNQTTTQYKTAETIAIALGIIILTAASFQALNNWEAFTSIETAKSFALPIFLSILFTPFLYTAALYSGYELLFIRLSNSGRNQRDVSSYARRRFVIHTAFRINRIKHFLQNHSTELSKIRSKQDVDSILERRSCH